MVTAVIMVAGCSDGNGATAAPNGEVVGLADQARDKGWTEQYEILRDGQVTRAEYESAKDATISCFREQGIEMYPPWDNPVNEQEISFDFPEGSGIPLEESVAGTDCQSVYSFLVEAAYLSTHEAVMAEPLRGYLYDCARSAGITLTGGESNLAGFLASAGETQEQAIRDCLDAGLRELYPELPSYSYG